mgnify:CR=1 FL=1
MPDDLKNYNNLTLAIHSTDNSFGFAYRENNCDLSDNFFSKKFEKDLCNNLIVDFTNFISKENLELAERIESKNQIKFFEGFRKCFTKIGIARNCNCLF